MKDTIYASFAEVSTAERAAGALLDHGVSEDDISLVVSESTYRDRSDFAAPSAAMEQRNEGASVAQPAEGDSEMEAKTGFTTTTPGDAAAGAAKGAAVGLGAGTLAAAASLIIPGFGPVLGGGALATAIAGAAGATLAGAVAGGVYGFLKDQGVPEDQAMRFEQAYQAGGAILSVRLPSNSVDRADAESILAKYGAANMGAYSAAT